MNYVVDLHTHTVASGHADNTIEEMIDAAKKKGLKMYGMTDHAKMMPGTCGEEYFRELKNKARQDGDLELCFGVELNILDYDGNVDMDEELLRQMDVTIASIHNTIGFHIGSREQNTNAYISAIRNPLINIIGHPDDGNMQVDYEMIVDEAVRNDTLLEINNNSLGSQSFRKNAEQNIRHILRICNEKKCPVIIGSDAHNVLNVGMHDRALKVAFEEKFPEELIMNFHLNKLHNYLNKYKLD